MKKTLFISAVLGALIFLFCGSALAAALNPNETYTINFSVIQSNGTMAAPAYSTTATADANGLVSFSLTGMPTNATCNFMDVNAVAPAGSPDAGVVRESVVPCPSAGTTMPLGLSEITNAQAQALVSAFKAAGTDDPILAVFMFAAVQSTSINSADLIKLAGYANQGISNMTAPGGYVYYLKNTKSVSDADLATYRKNIVVDLADPSAGYSYLIKASVDADAAGDHVTAAHDRGKAAALILQNLVKATKNPSSTSIHAGWVMEAIDRMGSIVVPLIQTNLLNDFQAIQAGIGTGLDQMRQQVVIQKYENAMSTLNASGADLTQFQNAAAALASAVNSANETFNQAAFPNGQAALDATIQAAQTAMNTAMENAFNDFQSAMAASSQEIGNSVAPAPSGSMIDKICTELGNPSMPDPKGGNQPCKTALVDMDNSWGIFKWYGPNGTQMNWPVNMVILANWVSDHVLGTGGNMTYTRDGAAIPASSPNDAGQFTGFCYDSTIQATCNADGWPRVWETTQGVCADQSVWDKTSCAAKGGTYQWKAIRSCFGKSGQNGEPLVGEDSICQGNPNPYWIMFAIQQDIWIEQSTQQNAKSDMQSQQTAQEALDTALEGIAANIGGTSDGVSIDKNHKKAIMELMSPPQL